LPSIVRCAEAVWLRHGGGVDADVPCAIIGNGIGERVWTNSNHDKDDGLPVNHEQIRRF
jgi:hypothetical protein